MMQIPLGLFVPAGRGIALPGQPHGNGEGGWLDIELDGIGKVFQDIVHKDLLEK